MGLKPRRRVGLAPGLTKMLNDRDKLVLDLMAVEQLAHSLGFNITARAINQAKNAWGWEVQGNTTQAALAALGKRPEDDALIGASKRRARK